MNTTEVSVSPANDPPPQASPRGPGAGILLNRNFESIEFPPEMAGHADWDVLEVQAGGEWYRPASPVYVSWLVEESRARLAGLTGDEREAMQAILRTNFDNAVRKMPILAVWAKNRVFVPADYRGPGQPVAGRRTLGGRVDMVVGPPYPARFYRIEDLSDQAIQFLGRNNASIQKARPDLFPAAPVTQKRRRRRA